jgi:uncharacterized membrane protein YtjA (UPF0391 family)
MGSLLKWAIILAIVALILGIFGFTGIAEGFADVAKLLFGVFLAILFVIILLGVFAYRAVTD